MARISPQYRMADRLAKGRLAEILLAFKAEGVSFDQASRILFADHGIEATRQTIAVWTETAERDAEAASA